MQHRTPNIPKFWNLSKRCYHACGIIIFWLPVPKNRGKNIHFLSLQRRYKYKKELEYDIGYIKVHLKSAHWLYEFVVCSRQSWVHNYKWYVNYLTCFSLEMIFWWAVFQKCFRAEAQLENRNVAMAYLIVEAEVGRKKMPLDFYHTAALYTIGGLSLDTSMLWNTKTRWLTD